MANRATEELPNTVFSRINPISNIEVEIYKAGALFRGDPHKRMLE